MNEQGWRRLDGLRALVHDGVERGSRFVERHHREAASVPFDVLAAVPAAQGVRAVHDAALTASYGSIRLVNRGVAAADAWLLAKVRDA
jgi:hypothetical protein